MHATDQARMLHFACLDHQNSRSKLPAGVNLNHFALAPLPTISPEAPVSVPCGISQHEGILCIQGHHNHNGQMLWMLPPDWYQWRPCQVHQIPKWILERRKVSNVCTGFDPHINAPVVRVRGPSLELELVRATNKLWTTQWRHHKPFQTREGQARRRRRTRWFSLIGLDGKGASDRWKILVRPSAWRRERCEAFSEINLWYRQIGNRLKLKLKTRKWNTHWRWIRILRF